jgi:hypothetical protein
VGRLCQLRCNACDKDAFLSAFRKPMLRCVGPPHGGACPHNFNVDVTCARAYVTLGELHLDHKQDLVVTRRATCGCRQALAALPRPPAHVGRLRRRHAAVPPALLGARGAAMLRFRFTSVAARAYPPRGPFPVCVDNSPLDPLRSRGLRWHVWMVARRVQWSPAVSAGYRSGHAHGSTRRYLSSDETGQSARAQSS